MEAHTLSTDFALAAAHYNNITLFEHQHHAIGAGLLEALATLFIKYEAHIHFGITLLHRHQDISSNELMVHSNAFVREIEIDLCKPEPLGLRALTACQFFLSDQHGYLPFEYLVGDTPYAEPSDDFLEQLAMFLVDNQLERVLGLSRITSSGDTWFEFTLAGGRGTVATQAIEIPTLDRVATEWAFLPLGNQIVIRETKACDKHPSGGHTRPTEPLSELMLEDWRLQAL